MPVFDRVLKQAGHKFFSGQEPSFATTLLSILVKAYGTEVFDWDGLTIQLQIKDDFDTEPPRPVYDKLMALLTALTTDNTYKEVPVFDEFVNAINGRGIGIEQDIPSVDDVAWAVTELAMNDPDPVSRNPEQPYSTQIAKYVRVVLDDEGMSIAPKALSFAADRAIRNEGFDDPEYFAGAWGSAQERADEVDAWLEQKALALIQQLMEIGIKFDAGEAA